MTDQVRLPRKLSEEPNAPEPRRPSHQKVIEQIDRWAMCGRLRVGKKNLHFAAMVGAAMCSACSRGTHDRWP